MTEPLEPAGADSRSATSGDVPSDVHDARGELQATAAAKAPVRRARPSDPAAGPPLPDALLRTRRKGRPAG